MLIYKGGIVGLANVGKSTFFQTITKSTLGNPANYPFATIDPEEAKVVVPSPRFDHLCQIYKPKSKVPANITIFDIAGLTRGASKGDGLGNAFLSHIRSVDGLFQVVRAFDDPEIIHIERSVDPVRDLEIIRDELALKDMEFATKTIELAEKALRNANPAVAKAKQEEITIAEKVLKWLEDGKRVANGTWSDREVEVINTMTLLTAKPSVYIVNISEEDYVLDCDSAGSDRMKVIGQWVSANSPGDSVVPLSVNLEERLAGLDPEQLEYELKELGVASALPLAISELRKSLQLISFFTCGKDEVREWTVRNGTRAPQAAGVIHQDLEKTFILANVVKYNDVAACNGDEGKLRLSGKIQQKGKDYTMNDGDTVHFKAGAARK
jgi:obg-like ATPase 1